MVRAHAEALAIVADSFGVSVAAILSKRRSRGIVRARWCAVWVLRDKFLLSYPEVGEVLGIDHSSAMHAIRRGAVLFETDELFRDGMSRVLRSTNEGLRVLALKQCAPNRWPSMACTGRGETPIR